MTTHSPLRAARRAAGHTQESLAEALDVGRLTIGNWERGLQSPQPRQRRPLATELRVTPDELDDVLRRTRSTQVSVALPVIRSDSVSISYGR